MPLVMIAGQPCSGKSTVAAALAEELRSAGLTVRLVSENELFPDRNACYKDLPSEKNTRAKLRSEVERLTTRTTTVVLDTLNNIKGYRYELWCIARAAGTRCCVVWVDTPAATARSWNAARPAAEAYSADVFDDLASRFEPPNSQTRWDSPLHVVSPGGAAAEARAAIVAVVQGLTAADAGVVAVGPNATVSKELRPNLATVAPSLSQTNLLHELDSAAQAVIQRITEAQGAAGAGAAGRVSFAGAGDLQLTEPVTLPDLRRHKRSFVRAATSGMSGKLGAGAAERTFVAYLRENLRGVAR